MSGTAGGTAERDGELTHLDDHGHARMVDITGKAVTERRAVARCVVRATPDAIKGLADDLDEPIALARAAGIQAAKQTSQLIPLCHPLPIDGVDVRIAAGDDGVEVGATALVVNRTGVEMEALTACGVAGLSILMALLRADPGAYLDELTLWHKSGGRSGTWDRDRTGAVVVSPPAERPRR
jgi:cyclic pyranopterin monophosphate synthase